MPMPYWGGVSSIDCKVTRGNSVRITTNIKNISIVILSLIIISTYVELCVVSIEYKDKDF